MKSYRAVAALVLLVAVFSSIAALFGVYSTGGLGQYQFQAITGEMVNIDGHGLYQHDSVSAAAQARAQDIVTIVVGLPLLLTSLILSRNGNLKARLVLTGTLGYFLYTYASYSFLSMYNSFFLVYVLLFSASLFAFIQIMLSFDVKKLSSAFNPKIPVRFIGGFLLFMAFAVGMMWLGRIGPALMEGAVPFGLEHYSTLTIQVLDLGVVVPVSILAGVLLIKRRSSGYLLASVMIIKGITMLTAISAMIIGQLLVGQGVSLSELLLFPAFNLVALYCLIIILKNIKEPHYSEVGKGVAR